MVIAETCFGHICRFCMQLEQYEINIFIIKENASEKRYNNSERCYTCPTFEGRDGAENGSKDGQKERHVKII